MFLNVRVVLKRVKLSEDLFGDEDQIVEVEIVVADFSIIQELLIIQVLIKSSKLFGESLVRVTEGCLVGWVIGEETDLENLFSDKPANLGNIYSLFWSLPYEIFPLRLETNVLGYRV